MMIESPWNTMGLLEKKLSKNDVTMESHEEQEMDLSPIQINNKPIMDLKASGHPGAFLFLSVFSNLELLF
jgi:hypothetical protein